MKQLTNYFIFVLCIVSTFLLTINGLTIVSAADVYPYKGTITAPTLVVHDEPNTLASSSVTEIAYGTVVDVVEKVKDKNIVKIKYDTDKEGYVSLSYVTNLDTNTLTESVAGVETYGDYCNTLVSGGFDKSYCPYLYYLHVNYPTWEFKADVLNVTLEEAALSQQGKGVLQTDNQNYWHSSKPIEGDYYYVKASVIASIMDPRNSLFDNRIFQFLDLEESSTIYNDTALKKISGSGNLSNYLEEFKQAAISNKINPLHIMARSAQEGANKSTYSGVTGLYTTNTKTDTYAGHMSHQGYSLDGYYNFYNINSYQDSDYDYTVQRGLAYAAGFLSDDKCITVDPNDPTKAVYDATKVKSDGKTICGELSYQRPWNTQAKAISGGADFVAEAYVRKGQDTLFYQKFNISSYTQYPVNTHQYMTNLGAPWNEGNTMQSAYKNSSLINSKFVFVIPVYKNMPDTVYQPVNKSDNSRLSSVTIADKAFTEFDSDVVEYNYNLVTTEDTFKVGALTEDSLATVIGTGDYTFINGVVQVKIVVTAEDGSTTTYVINVKKVVPEEVVKVSDITSKMGVKIDDSIIYGISPETVVSSLVNTVTKNKGEAKVTDASGKVKASGSFVTGDKIIIKGTSEEKTFTIAVRGDINGDGLVDLKDFVLIQSHILEKSKLTGVKSYAGDVNYDGKIVLADFVLVQSHILKKQSL